MESSQRQHVHGLDGIRGLAILMVVFFHTHGHTMYRLDRNHDGDIPSRFVSWIADLCSHGVDIFFVLSGYLITGILLANLSTPAVKYFRNFYMRRSLRIFPLYFGLLFVAFVLTPTLGIQYTTAGMIDAQKNQAWLWLYSSNFGRAIYGLGFGRFSHFWTLAIEEHFYLIWPAIIWFCGAANAHWACLSVISCSILCRIGFAACGDDASTYFLTPCRADALAMGGLLACGVRCVSTKFLRSRETYRYAQLIVLFTLIASILFVLTLSQINFVSLTLFPILLSILSASLISIVVLAQHSASPCLLSKFLNNSWLCRFGKYSYAMYVFHVLIIPIVFVVLARVSTMLKIPIESCPFLVVSAGCFLVTAAGCFLISFFSWELYEKHFLSLKRYF